MNRAKKKKTFVLLEILIAFALVSISILPFLHYPFQHMRQEMDLLFEMELEKIAQNQLAETQVKLYKREIESNWIFTKEEKKRQINEENDLITIELFKDWKRTYIKKVFINWERQKLSDDRMLSVLVNIQIQLFSPNQLRKPIFSAETKILAQKKT